jgi:transcriptional antiterminator RfaH
MTEGLDDGSWYAVNTEPRHEQLARGEIGQIGIGVLVYLPMDCKAENGGRAKRVLARPMFASYLFVRCLALAEMWERVKAARGVRRFLGCGHPVPISQGVIEAVRLVETERAETAAHRPSGIVWDFKPEDRVRIKAGPFAGLYAELESSVDKHDRIRALFGVLGRVELSAFDIEAT